jgi:hypothetical protein
MDEQTKTQIWELAAGTFIAVSVVSGMAFIMANAIHVLIKPRRCPLRSETDGLCATAANDAMARTGLMRCAS